MTVYVLDTKHPYGGYICNEDEVPKGLKKISISEYEKEAKKAKEVEEVEEVEEESVKSNFRISSLAEGINKITGDQYGNNVTVKATLRWEELF